MLPERPVCFTARLSERKSTCTAPCSVRYYNEMYYFVSKILIKSSPTGGNVGLREQI